MRGSRAEGEQDYRRCGVVSDGMRLQRREAASGTRDSEGCECRGEGESRWEAAVGWIRVQAKKSEPPCGEKSDSRWGQRRWMPRVDITNRCSCPLRLR